MNDFDLRLEAGLARMLDSVVTTPPPPRRRPRGRPALHVLSVGTTPFAQQEQPPVAVLADARDPRLDAAALAEVSLVAAPALI